LALAKYGGMVVIMRNVIESEHPDNNRFAREAEEWFGQKIVELRSDKFATHWDVIEHHRFISSPGGAKCTVELKHIPRLLFTEDGDINILGYTADARDAARAARLRRTNHGPGIETPLIDAGLMRADCLAIIERAGIALPAMYGLGFENNNCIGCAKATSPTYWNRVRRNFPDAFDRMAKIQRTLNFSQVKLNGVMVFLDELPEDAGRADREPDIECSLFCHIAEADLTS
jgi:hypothetical protein